MTSMMPFVWMADDTLLPAEAPLAMPVSPLDAPAEPLRAPRPEGVGRRRALVWLLTALAVGVLGWAMGAGLLEDGLQWVDILVLAFFLPNIAWIGFGAATAIVGSLRGLPSRPGRELAGWVPKGMTAVLIPVRNEDTGPLTARITALRNDLGRSSLAGRIAIYVLSDSDDAQVIAREVQMTASLVDTGSDGVPVYYRRRVDNAARKPGNISEWVRRWGGAYDYMLVLDADSRMAAAAVTGLIHRMETSPGVGLVQAGMHLTGGESRFGRIQQRATRLYGPTFAAGVAAWAGTEGNYWGHNALIRVAAFADAAGLPPLKGQAPAGGDVLSHDFIEAAWLRRAGWAVVFEPNTPGSAEGGPQTLMAFHKRDRRWCQGNLQHLRVLFGAEGLHPVSRLHLVCGIGSYLAAPLWLGLVLAATLSQSTGALILPVIGAIGLIMIPKILGIAHWIGRRPQAAGRILRGAAAEIAISTLLAPIIMVRQTLAVASVLAGQDCGWKPAVGGRSSPGSDEMPWLEPAVGVALLLAVLPQITAAWQVVFVLPIVLPLLVAPYIGDWLDGVPEALPRGRRPSRITRGRATAQRPATAQAGPH